MNVLVTGAAGFIGSHLVEHLLAKTDHSIVAVDDFCDYYSPARKRANVQGFVGNPRVDFREGNLCCSDFTKSVVCGAEVDAVIHLAAHAGVTPSVAAPRRYMENNILTTLALLESARQRPLRRFLFVSSSTVYGTNCPTPFIEDGPMGIPASPYGTSKRAAELLCLTYHQLHGLPLVILRPFSVYGPRLRPDLALSIFATCILQGRDITLYGDGLIQRDFTHVSDICAGLANALNAEGTIGEAINLGHDHPLTIRSVIKSLEEALEIQATIRYCDVRIEDLLTTHADLTKANHFLQYQPKISFEDGVKEFADWIRSV